MFRKSTLVNISCGLSLALVAIAAAPEPAAARGVVRFDNGRWWDGEGFVERTVFSIEGRLASDAPAAVDSVVDLAGGWVVPPLADAHDHALADPTFEETSRGYLAQGVFYVQNPSSLRTLTAAVRPLAERPETVDVTYSLGSLTSTGGHPVQIYDRIAASLDGWTAERMPGEAYHLIDDAGDLAAAWPEIVAAGPDFLKVILERSEEHESRRDDPAFYGRRGLDPELMPEVIERAHAAGLRVVVHATSLEDVRTAVTAGADELAHLPLEPLETEDAVAIASAGVVVTTTTLSHRPTDGVEDLDALNRHNLEILMAHDARLVLGTDSERSVLDEADNLVRLGIDPAVVLRLAVEETARWIFPERDLGRLDDGAEASFLVLAADPRGDLGALRWIRTAVKQGHPIDLSVEAELPGVAQALAHTLMRAGAGAALAELERLETEEPGAWDFGEAQINGLGYFALEHGRTEDAVTVFEANTERHPDSSNVWDSLGDGLAAAGDTARARQSYERALALDPAAEHTRDKLAALPEGRDR